MYLPDKLTMEVKGRDMVTGLPKIIEVTSDDVTAAIKWNSKGSSTRSKRCFTNATRTFRGRHGQGDCALRWIFNATKL